MPVIVIVWPLYDPKDDVAKVTFPVGWCLGDVSVTEVPMDAVTKVPIVELILAAKFVA
jgi:hypothetical protein